MDFTIIGNNFKDYTPSRLIEEARKAGLSIQKVLYKDLDFVIEKDRVQILHNGKELQPSKIVIVRLAGFPQRRLLINWFKEHGAYVMNEELYLKWGYLDKFTQHLEFQKAGIPFVPTLNISSKNKLVKKNDFPYVVKLDLSSKGNDVYKITSKEQISSIVPSRYKPRKLLVQPVLPAGEDLRVVILAGKAVGAMLRKAKDRAFLTNFSAGGEGYSYDLDKDREAREIAEKVALVFGAEYAGIDLMKDSNGDWKVLEINNTCQFEGFEKSTGINFAGQVISYLQQKTLE